MTTAAPTAVEGGGVAAYPRAGGAAGVRRMVRDFYRLVLGDDELRRYFAAADLADLYWHQAAQLTLTLGGPDWYQATGASGAYLPVVVPAPLFHRSAFYLVRAVDQGAGSREVVTPVASALAARTCRIIGGFPVPGALTPPAVVSVEGTW